MFAGTLLAHLQLLDMGGGAVVVEAGGLVCGTPAVAPRVTGTAALVGRVSGTVGVAGRVTGTAGVEEC